MLHRNNKLLCVRLCISAYHVRMKGHYRTTAAWEKPNHTHLVPVGIWRRNYRDHKCLYGSGRMKQTRQQSKQRFTSQAMEEKKKQSLTFVQLTFAISSSWFLLNGRRLKMLHACLCIYSNKYHDHTDQSLKDAGSNLAPVATKCQNQTFTQSLFCKNEASYALII